MCHLQKRAGRHCCATGQGGGNRFRCPHGPARLSRSPVLRRVSLMRCIDRCQLPEGGPATYPWLARCRRRDSWGRYKGGDCRPARCAVCLPSRCKLASVSVRLMRGNRLACAASLEAARLDLPVTASGADAGASPSAVFLVLLAPISREAMPRPASVDVGQIVAGLRAVPRSPSSRLSRRCWFCLLLLVLKEPLRCFVLRWIEL